jgi:anti-sigma factor ChrR (cupin superfamily)
MGGWRQLRKGIQIKRLVRDDARNIQMDILKIEPGFKDFPHWHNDWEWVYILEGDLEDEKGIHRPGDFIINQRDVRHQPTSKEGCTLICVWCGSVRQKP